MMTHAHGQTTKTHKDQLANRLHCLSVALQCSVSHIERAAADCEMACSRNAGMRSSLRRKLDRLLNKLATKHSAH